MTYFFIFPSNCAIFGLGARFYDNFFDEDWRHFFLVFSLRWRQSSFSRRQRGWGKWKFCTSVQEQEPSRGAKERALSFQFLRVIMKVAKFILVMLRYCSKEEGVADDVKHSTKSTDYRRSGTDESDESTRGSFRTITFFRNGDCHLSRKQRKSDQF